jgi:pimeloyl-ACP methyl ester carboxylesterase
MDRAELNGIELEYEVSGSGEPVLLIGPGPIADSFLPFQSERALTVRYRLIRYRQRGQTAGSHVDAPVSFAEHAADAAALVGQLGISRTHVVGHSTGAAIALQLAVDRPEMVRTLALLEPPLPSAPSAAVFFEKAGPSLAAHEAGDRRQAMAGFLSLASSLDWEACRAVIGERIPGGVERAIDDADIFFGSYLPALTAWRFGPDQAAVISQPVLSVRGTETDGFFVEGHELLRSWFPQIEECTIEGVAHLLHLQRPTLVAERLAEFLARHSIAGT